MTDAHELHEAAKGVLPFLEASTDQRDRILAIETSAEARQKANAAFDASMKISRVERLRREADELEAKDTAILRFRAAVAAFDGDTPNGADNNDLSRQVREAVRDVIRQEREE